MVVIGGGWVVVWELGFLALIIIWFWMVIVEGISSGCEGW